MREVLVGALGAQAVVVGADFHFGHRRQGNVALLQRMGGRARLRGGGPGAGRRGRPAGHGWSTARARPSSTAIRLALADGDLPAPPRCWGGPTKSAAPVVRGDGRARTLGFRTANVAVPTEICLPADGIYAGWYLRPDGVATAGGTVARVGGPPSTSTPTRSLLEAHLLDFDGDLYDEAARVRFAARLRAEEKFDSVDALVAQMGRDCDQARSVLRRLQPGDGLSR